MIDFIRHKNCLECGSRIAGRIDKKFCGDQCRIAWHNKMHGDDDHYIRNVNNILRKNRRILADLIQTRRKVGVDKLAREGFDFEYFTSTGTTKKGLRYNYCYDHGYMSLHDGSYMLVRLPTFGPDQ